jgi:hypothetical protein
MFHISKDNSLFNAMVFTENQPAQKDTFENIMSKGLRERYGTNSIYIYFKHGVGDMIKDYNKCLSEVDKIFGDIGNTTFTVKKMEDAAVGKLIVLEWKNPRAKRSKML